MVKRSENGVPSVASQGSHPPSRMLMRLLSTTSMRISWPNEASCIVLHEIRRCAEIEGRIMRNADLNNVSISADVFTTNITHQYA